MPTASPEGKRMATYLMSFSLHDYFGFFNKIPVFYRQIPEHHIF
uniref:Uncharacterized protein n=1 Tax=Arundo donax TaxID=35708 RepID=A0A0A9DI41_ARUDO